MIGLNHLAIGVAAVAAFVATGAYYAAFGKVLEKFSSAPTDMPPWLLAVEVAKHFVVAAVVAGLATGIGITAWQKVSSRCARAALLGLILWLAFPVMLLLGSVVHERVPWQLAALHAGDWLLKLLAISLVVGSWSGKRALQRQHSAHDARVDG
ncbi:MAG: DUF1761 domain-containing protein [Steroidobacteraceae bacterium]